MRRAICILFLFAASFHMKTLAQEINEGVTIQQVLVVHHYHPQKMVNMVKGWFTERYKPEQHTFEYYPDIGLMTSQITLPFISKHNNNDFYATGTISYKLSVYMTVNKICYVFSGFYHLSDISNLFIPEGLSEQEIAELKMPYPISMGLVTREEKCPFSNTAKPRWNNKVWEEIHSFIKMEFQQKSISLTRLILGN